MRRLTPEEEMRHALEYWEDRATGAEAEIERLRAEITELLEERQRHLDVVFAARLFIEQTDEYARELRAALNGMEKA